MKYSQTIKVEKKTVRLIVKRVKTLAFLFLIWGGIIFAHMVYFNMLYGKKYLQKSEHLAKKYGLLNVDNKNMASASLERNKKAVLNRQKKSIYTIMVDKNGKPVRETFDIAYL